MGVVGVNSKDVSEPSSSSPSKRLLSRSPMDVQDVVEIPCKSDRNGNGTVSSLELQSSAEPQTRSRISEKVTGFVMPSLAALEKMAKGVTDELVEVDDGDGEEDQQSDFSKSTKTMSALTRVSNLKAVKKCQDPPTNVSKLPQRHLMKSQIEFQHEVMKILKSFFKCAFTIIVKNRRLCPSEAFQTGRMLGVLVPRFIHQSSLEYVEEVSKKLVLFLNRNSTEGCVMHVMIEKNKALHIVQRFVFRAQGYVETGGDSEDNSDESACDLDEVKRNCRRALLQLMNSNSIKPMILPQFSRWSVSIGIKSESLVGANEEALSQLWNSDPTSHYFPWRKRQKSLVNSNLLAQTQSATKLTEADPDFPIRNPVSCSASLSVKIGAIEVSERESKSSPSRSTTVERSEVESYKTLENVQAGNGPLETHTSTSTTNNKLELPGNNVATTVSAGTICFPVCSFPVTAGMMISIYGLEYPAVPAPSSHNTPISLARGCRTPSLSVRLTHLRNRMSRTNKTTK